MHILFLEIITTTTEVTSTTTEVTVTTMSTTTPVVSTTPLSPESQTRLNIYFQLEDLNVTSDLVDKTTPTYKSYKQTFVNTVSYFSVLSLSLASHLVLSFQNCHHILNVNYSSFYLI